MPRLFFMFMLFVSLLLSGCATAGVGGAIVGGVATTAKYAVKGTVGAGKLVYRGGKAVVKGTKRLLSDDEEVPSSIADDYKNLPDAEKPAG
ncbi:MAG: hypothetical protein V3V04_04860 [Rhizobiaceae bacterium]